MVALQDLRLRAVEILGQAWTTGAVTNSIGPYSSCILGLVGKKLLARRKISGSQRRLQFVITEDGIRICQDFSALLHTFDEAWLGPPDLVADGDSNAGLLSVGGVYLCCILSAGSASIQELVAAANRGGFSRRQVGALTGSLAHRGWIDSQNRRWRLTEASQKRIGYFQTTITEARRELALPCARPHDAGNGIFSRGNSSGLSLKQLAAISCCLAQGDGPYDAAEVSEEMVRANLHSYWSKLPSSRSVLNIVILRPGREDRGGTSTVLNRDLLPLDDYANCVRIMQQVVEASAAYSRQLAAVTAPNLRMLPLSTISLLHALMMGGGEISWGRMWEILEKGSLAQRDEDQGCFKQIASKLAKNGLLDRWHRGKYRITPEGNQALAANLEVMKRIVEVDAKVNRH